MSEKSLTIGHIISVHGDTIEVQICVENLEIEHMDKQYRVGKLGTYVTVPVATGTLIGYITDVGVRGELEPRPNPGAPRRICLTSQLLGTVRKRKFSRGVDDYPTLGDEVKIAVDDDFYQIFGSFAELALKADDHPRAFSMGKFAVDADFEVFCLGKDFFSKHVAVMGNSGSGKSCTTAKIVYEALKMPHAQVVMFDMHGEYLAAFSNEHGHPDPNVTYLSDRNLVLPYWMLRYEEFEQIFVDTNNPLTVNAQRIFLRSAFEKLRRPAAEALDLLNEYTIDTPVYYSMEHLKTYAENMNDARYVLGTQNYAFTRLPHRSLDPDEQEKLLLSRRMEFNQGNPEGEVPHATYHGKLLGLVNQLETRMNDRRYDFLLRPFEAAQRNEVLHEYFKGAMTPGQLSKNVSWVIRQMLGRLNPRKNLTIVDLSGLPFDVVDITVAVLTRALFDFNFWSPVEQRQPVVLVFEEAHNYLPREARGRKTFARDAVEKVAKEGRKYGVAAMIVSQRPSEISETVLSQCNTMVLMRMNNPDDQNYAGRVVSDQFRSLIELLPALRPGEGFIIGDAVLMPMRTLIDLPPKLPRSSNLDFFKLWYTGTNTGNVEQIIDRWWRQDRSSTNQERRKGPRPPKDRNTEPRAVPDASRTQSLPDENPQAEQLIAESTEPYETDGRETAELTGGAELLTQSDCDPAISAPSTVASAEEKPKSTAARKLAELAAMLTGKE